MSLDWLYIATGFLAAFLFLGPAYKALLALLFMTSFFDLLPSRVMEVELWDIGAVLLYIALLHLVVTGRFTFTMRDSYIKLLLIFICWLVFCFAWSFFVNGYPLLETIQCARQMMLGYPMFFIFFALFENVRGSFFRLLKIMYFLVFLLLLVHIAQYLLQVKILQGLVTTYRDHIRGLPIFLPIALFFMWQNLTRLLSGERTTVFDKIFVVVVAFSTLITFTRGIYLAVLIVMCLMMLLLILENRMKLNRIAILFTFASVIFGVLLLSGHMDKVIERGMSGIKIIMSSTASVDAVHDADTFHGRLALVSERINMVLAENPLVGYGFIHERITKEAGIRVMVGGLRPDGISKSVYSADIAWGNIAIFTGLFGLLLFICFILSVAVNYLANLQTVSGPWYYLRLSFILQFFCQVLLMFNGNNFSNLLHIPLFMLAGYAFCTRLGKAAAIQSE